MTDGATNAVSIHQGAYDTCSCLDTKRVHIPPSVGTVTQTTAHFAPWIRLVSSTGALLGNSFTQTGASNIAATAPTSGTYTEIGRASCREREDGPVGDGPPVENGDRLVVV